MSFVKIGAKKFPELLIKIGSEYLLYEKNTIDMTSDSPARHIFSFTVPLILTNMGQQFYMIVDGAIVGRGVGVKALAAVGATDWCYWLILWTVGGLAQGFSTFVSRAFGERNYSEMNKTIAASTELCFFIGLFFTIAGIAAAKLVLRILNTPADILPGASAYLMTMISGTLIVMGYNLSSAILRGLGDGRSPLVAMVIAALLNIGLDCLFLFFIGESLVLFWPPYLRSWYPFCIVCLPLEELNLFLLINKIGVLIFAKSRVCFCLVSRFHFSML